MGAGAPLARVCDSDPGAIRVLPRCPPVRGIREMSAHRGHHPETLR
jgi:hypothetical protein